MRTHHTITLLAAAGLLALTGCSTDPAPAKTDDPAPAPVGSSATPAPKLLPARPDLEKAVRAYSDAYFKPDGATAYAALSKRCQDRRRRTLRRHRRQRGQGLRQAGHPDPHH